MDEHSIEEYFEKIMEDKNEKWYRQGIRDEHPKVDKQHEKIGGLNCNFTSRSMDEMALYYSRGCL